VTENIENEEGVPSVDELTGEYEEYYRDSLDRWDSQHRNAFHEEILSTMFGSLGRTPTRILDVGCGTGMALEVLGQTWPEASLAGIDLSSVALSAARGRVPHAQLEQCALGAAALQGQFDLITILGTLEHLPDPVVALTQLAQLMTDDGILYVEVPNCISLPFSEKVEGFRRLNGYSRQIEWHLFRPSWETNIRRSGLHIAVPVVGPRVGMEFTWIIAKTPMKVPKRTLSKIRQIEKQSREHMNANKWVPSLVDRVKILLRRSMGDRVYDRIKRAVSGPGTA
jgi:SAM-dependent methyltransferase